MSDALYFRQLLAGRDFAVGDAVALSMRNFTYAIGDRRSGEAVLVDPAYRPAELIEILEADGMKLVGAIATHYHPDHIGGTLIGRQHIAGIVELREMTGVPIHAHVDERSWILERTGIDESALITHDDRDQLRVGDIEITLLHTPGHTKGSQCLLVEGHLLSGDTLFIDGCGRTDFPGGDTRELFVSLNERLSKVSDDTVLFPGHLYSTEGSLPMGDVRERNPVLSVASLEQWLTMFGS
ncbi:MAG TPA: MBL fold metallo-hydrolase [Acidimicrobiales bacterium]|jgi:glyoxylase-like metal-dependent hydrolase (beta-lactamase superfamily II)